MESSHSRLYGWTPDLPDHRDYTPQHAKAQDLLSSLDERGADESLPESVDWTEYCPPVVDQGCISASSAHACVAMVQYFELRARGRVIEPSRMFVHQNALRLANSGMHGRVSLRTTLKAMVRFGLPPERFWPYDPARLETTADGFVYAFQQAMRGCRYVRLDAARDGQRVLNTVRSFLASGFVSAVGFPIVTTLSAVADIYFPVAWDACSGGHAVLLVGYDDNRRIRSDKGAFLIRNSCGDQWGNKGYGWLSYRYIREHLAVDVWTLLKPCWMRSDEFSRPLFLEQPQSTGS